MNLDRRQLLGGGALAAAGALTAFNANGDRAAAQGAADAHGGKAHGGGAKGPTMRKGGTVDHGANGFNPTDLLRDFDMGKTRRLATGRTLREWEVVGADKEIEIAPGIFFPAWTYNGQVPGPTIRCNEGDRLRVHFTNSGSHPHTIHFHGIHSAFMDGSAGIGRGGINPGRASPTSSTPSPSAATSTTATPTP